MTRVSIRIDRLDPDVRLSDLTASGIGTAVLCANDHVDDVIVAGYDAQGVPQEWAVKRSEGPEGGWMPTTTLAEPTPAAEVVHDQGDLDGLEAARATDDEGKGDE